MPEPEGAHRLPAFFMAAPNERMRHLCIMRKTTIRTS